MWHEKPHNYKVKRGSSAQHTLPVLYLVLRSTEHTIAEHHTAAVYTRQTIIIKYFQADKAYKL